MLGFILNSELMTVRPPQDKVESLIGLCDAVLASDLITIRTIAKLLGKGKEDPLYKDQFIADDSEVQMHMKTLYEKMGSQDYNEDKMCGSSYWQAARKIKKFASSLAKQYAKTKKKLAETLKEKNALLSTTEVPPDATTSMGKGLQN
eukprot:gene11565-12760_t